MTKLSRQLYTNRINSSNDATCVLMGNPSVEGQYKDNPQLRISYYRLADNEGILVRTTTAGDENSNGRHAFWSGDWNALVFQRMQPYRTNHLGRCKYISHVTDNPSFKRRPHHLLPV